MSKERDKSIERASRLLGDLESLRTVLEEGEERGGAEESRSGDRSYSEADTRHSEADSSRGEPDSGRREPDRPHGDVDRSGAGSDEDVPLLEDVVHGGVSVNESFLAGEGHFDLADPAESALDDEVFKALLSDQWRDSARDLLDKARAVIEKHQTDWTPAHTDELNEALRVRIDDTIDQWLRQIIQERVDELRAKLLDAVAGELEATVASRLQPTSAQHDEDPDGA